MATTRREFLKTGSVAALALGLQDPPTVFPRGRPIASPVVDADFREVVMRTLDAARAAGASYADVRVTFQRKESIIGRSVSREEQLALGVRALVDGAWGFVSTREFSGDETIRVAQAAVAQARANTWGRPRTMELSVVGAIRDEAWTMPVKRDPFDVATADKMQFMVEAETLAMSLPDVIAAVSTQDFLKEEKTFASTEGSFFVQTRYITAPTFRIVVTSSDRSATVTRDADLSPMGLGWEGVTESGLKQQIPELAEQGRMKARAKPVRIGRYDIVFNAEAIASVFGDSIGRATELDRAMGYEANAGGTSYLSPPDAILGKFRLGPDFLNVKGDRSQPGSCSRVQWDDEGVAPDEFTLVKNGIVDDYQTTREQAPWIGEWYAQRGVPARSHGCSASESAFFIPIQHRPNISIVPGKQDIGFHDLVSGTDKGLAFVGASGGYTDQQYLNWQVQPNMVYEIKNGKLGAAVSDCALLMRAPEFWKSLAAIGGANAYRLGGQGGFRDTKGQPSQESYFGIGTVPAKFPRANIVNIGTQA